MQKFFHKSDKLWLLIDAILGLSLLALAVCGLYTSLMVEPHSSFLIFICSVLLCISTVYVYIPLIVFIYDRNTCWNYCAQSGIIHYFNEFTGDVSFHITRVKQNQRYKMAWLWVPIEYYRLILDDETEILISSVTEEPFGISKMGNPVLFKRTFLFQHFLIHIIKHYHMGRRPKQ